MDPVKPQPDRPASEYEAERRRKRQELRALGVNPYGRRVEGITPLAELRRAGEAQVPADQEGTTFTIAGRVVLKRDMGKLSFLTLRDESGDLQVGLQKNKLDDLGWEIRNRLDLGDQVVATGPLGTTKTGEPTIWATSLAMTSKSLLVPPDKHKGLEDVELRYRQRYVDLWANPETMRLAQLRIQIVERMRKFWRDKGFLEVETPMLQPLHGGAAARPFTTHMNALDIPLYLRIAPELYLKRLLVGGFRKVFEINRNFRNEGISPRHNPEFTMLEAYEAYGSWETMAALVEEMICTIAQEVLGTLVIEHKDYRGVVTRTIHLLNRPWPRRPMVDLVEEFTGWRYEREFIGEKALDALTRRRVQRKAQVSANWCLPDHPEWQNYLAAADSVRDWEDRANTARRALRKECDLNQTMLSALQDSLVQGDAQSREPTLEERARMQAYSERGDQAHRAMERLHDAYQSFSDVTSTIFWKIREQSTPEEQLQYVFETEVEPYLIEPCFVTRVPSRLIPLARPCEDDVHFAEVYELAINGTEISPGYTELNDPDVQEQLFRAQVGDEAERQQIDEDFLTALKYGMPPAGGMGLGVDRLVAMLTGAPSLRDVILFPLMRPR